MGEDYPRRLRVFVDYTGKRAELPHGEVLVGRGLHCGVRFNDPGVSREHLKIVVANDQATMIDMGSKNATLHNGEPLAGSVRLCDGDTVKIGHIWFTVRLQEEHGPSLIYDEETMTVRDGARAKAASAEIRLPSAEGADALPKEHNCPRCRTLVPVESRQCPRCSYTWPRQRILALTRELPQLDVPIDRRSHTRHPVAIPTIYTSKTLTFEAVSRDLSKGGAFIAAQLLDPIGTECTVTLLPDGTRAAAFPAVVAHASVDDEQPGMGIRFTEVSASNERWLVRQLALMGFALEDT